jgi:hypothetical protein
MAASKAPLPAAALKSTAEDVKSKTSVIAPPPMAGVPKVGGIGAAPAPKPAAPAPAPVKAQAPAPAPAGPAPAAPAAPRAATPMPAPMAPANEGFPTLALAAMLLSIVSLAVTLMGYLDVL